MQEIAIIISVAYLLDLLFGDPPWLPHPVRAIGWIIEKLETSFRTFIKNERLSGLVFSVSIAAFSGGVIFIIVRLGDHLNHFAGIFLSILFIYTTLSIKDLKIESMKVYEALKDKNLMHAKQKLSMIVGRDTANLSEPEIIRATVETIAENTVDGIISPLFYAFIGGAPLALAYKAVNTLDSMVGYKNEKYKDFGWAAAKVDDIANFIPARISAVLLPVASRLAGKNIRGSWRIVLRDRRKNSSPNSGIPEAAIAGTLGIQLGGESYYNGVAVNKALIGDRVNLLQIEHIRESINISYVCSILLVILGIIIVWIMGKG